MDDSSQAVSGAWAEYVEADVRRQNQLAEVERPILDAKFEVERLLRAGSTAPYLLEMQERLGQAVNIIGRQMRKNPLSDDPVRWSATLSRLLELRTQGGKDCCAMLESLPAELPGTVGAAAPVRPDQSPQREATGRSHGAPEGNVARILSKAKEGAALTQREVTAITGQKKSAVYENKYLVRIGKGRAVRFTGESVLAWLNHEKDTANLAPTP